MAVSADVDDSRHCGAGSAFAGIMLFGHCVCWSTSGLVMSSKISTLMVSLGSQKLRVFSSWLEVFSDLEINCSLATSLHGKPPAIHSQSLVSEISEEIYIESSEAK